MVADTILVIHGFGGHRWLMAPLAARLRRRGYATVNWGYRSLFRDIPAHAERLKVELERLQQRAEVSNFHIVAHSMGALVTRQALLVVRPDKLKRIVLLCPPNRGSHVASRFASSLGRFSQTLAQLSDQPGGFADRLTPSLGTRYEVGIILAETDFVVQSQSTQLPGVEHYRIVPGFHSSMLFNQQTAKLVDDFIRTGNFDAPQETLQAHSR